LKLARLLFCAHASAIIYEIGCKVTANIDNGVFCLFRALFFLSHTRFIPYILERNWKELTEIADNYSYCEVEKTM